MWNNKNDLEGKKSWFCGWLVSNTTQGGSAVVQQEQMFKYLGNSGPGKRKAMKSGLAWKNLPEFNLGHMGSQDPQGGCLQKKTKGEEEKEWRENPATMERKQPLLEDLHGEGNLGKAHQSQQTLCLSELFPLWFLSLRTLYSVPLAKWRPACFSWAAASLGCVVRGDAFMKQTGVLFCNICKMHMDFLRWHMSPSCIWHCSHDYKCPPLVQSGH